VLFGKSQSVVKEGKENEGVKIGAAVPRAKSDSRTFQPKPIRAFVVKERCVARQPSLSLGSPTSLAPAIPTR
jgi:hypothetical protein